MTRPLKKVKISYFTDEEVKKLREKYEKMRDNSVSFHKHMAAKEVLKVLNSLNVDRTILSTSHSLY